MSGALRRLLFPQRLCCHGCGQLLLQGEGLLCEACAQALARCSMLRREETLYFKADQLLTAAAFRYEGKAAELINSLKYGADRAAADTLAAGMARRYALMPQLHATQVCVAVPSYPRQARRRGYAQAQVLCDAFTALTGLPAALDTLTRVRYAKSQVGMNREERKRQIIGAFAVNAENARPVRDQCVLLIDDVLTTGATACECARVLYAAGARRVLALTACAVR